MVDIINSLNTTTFPYKSIIIGGSSYAPIPEYDPFNNLPTEVANTH